MKITTPEKDIQLSICQYLEAKRYFFWRNNTTPIFDTAKKSWRRMPAYSKKGVPDIIVIREGKFIGIEVKSSIGKMSEEQKDFEKRSTTCGAIYILARSIEDVIRFGL